MVGAPGHTGNGPGGQAAWSSRLGSDTGWSVLYFIYLYFWLRWVFVAVRRLLTAVASLVAEAGI